MSRPTIKNRAQLAHMRRAGLVVAKIHAALRGACRPGVTGSQLDALVRQVTAEAGAQPNFLGYHGFPGAVCLSVNDTVVHGIPAEKPLEAGDLVSFDCGASVTGEGANWHADAAFTMVVPGADRSPRGERAAELNRMTEGAMWAGIAALAGARRVGEVGAAIEDYVQLAGEDAGWTPGIIEGYAGHGIGRDLHEAPTVYNYRTRGRTERVKPGMVLCVEPMLVAGDLSTRVLGDDWAVVTTDGADAAHWEHTVAILPGGISVLTSPDGGREGLAPFGVEPVRLAP